MNMKKEVSVLAFLVVCGTAFFIVRAYQHAPVGTDTMYAQKLAACGAFPNGSEQSITDTSRVFINLPKDIYPDKEHNLQFTTAKGSATAGWISNGGPYGEAMSAQDKPGCWSYYYEFDGQGEIDLSVKSALTGIPDYSVRFIVTKNPAD